MDDIEEIARLARSERLILFIGSGVSASLGLPDWNGLIRIMSDELGFDHALFTMLGRFESLAEYYFLCGGSKAKLAKWMRKNWHSSSIRIEDSVIHQFIASLNVPIIYTTNYDHWIERAMRQHKKPFRRIVSGFDLSKVERGETEVIKFHGDIIKPATMVVTEADYFERLKFEGELDIRLRSDLQKYSLLFLGYSLSDINLRNMIYRLSLFRDSYSRRGGAIRSFVFTNRINDVQERLFDSWGITTIYGNKIDNKESLFEFLHLLSKKVRDLPPAIF